MFSFPPPNPGYWQFMALKPTASYKTNCKIKQELMILRPLSG